LEGTTHYWPTTEVDKSRASSGKGELEKGGGRAISGHGEWGIQDSQGSSLKTWRGVDVKPKNKIVGEAAKNGYYQACQEMSRRCREEREGLVLIYTD